DGVGGDPDADAPLAQRFELHQVLGDARLPEALDPAATISGVEQDKTDPGFLGGLEGRKALVEPQIVELADRRVAGAELLAIDVYVVLADLARCQSRSHGQHRLAPGPEVAALCSAPQGPLERVAMGVHEPRKREPLGHRRILSAWPPAPSPLRWLRFRTSSRSAAWF